MGRRLPELLIDRWQHRVEPEPGPGTLYWHILLGDNVQAQAVARQAQERLACTTGLHMTPMRWLHMTALIVGSTDTITPDHIQMMLAGASRRLSKVPPIVVTLGRILYHPEAIMLGVRPEVALNPIHDAVRAATRETIGMDGGVTGGSTLWTPHMTVCYSTAQQQAAPIIAALGDELPGSEVTVSAVSLVIQRGAERLWDWHPVGVARLCGGYEE